MRIFIAVELPKGIRERLDVLQEQLKSCSCDVKWVEPENIHLTLKFLGETEDTRIKGISKAIEEVGCSIQAFQARICALGAFPKIEFPRVIWAGIDLGDDQIKNIAHSLEDKLSPLGIPKENRPFSSHITLGRTRSNLNRQRLVQGLKTVHGNIGQENLEFSVTKITLFKSTLTPKGAVYEALKEATLKTT